MDTNYLAEVKIKNDTEYFIQEAYEGPKSYLCMTRKAQHVLDCEIEAVNDLPRETL